MPQRSYIDSPQYLMWAQQLNNASRSHGSGGGWGAELARALTQGVSAYGLKGAIEDADAREEGRSKGLADVLGQISNPSAGINEIDMNAVKSQPGLAAALSMSDDEALALSPEQIQSGQAAPFASPDYGSPRRAKTLSEALSSVGNADVQSDIAPFAIESQVAQQQSERDAMLARQISDYEAQRDFGYDAALEGVKQTNDVPTGMRRQPDGSWSYDENYLQGQVGLRQAGRPNVQVGVDVPDSTLNNIAVEAYDKADVQRAIASDAEFMMSLLDQGLDTNALRPIGAKVAGYLNSVGINVDENLPMAEAFQAMSNQAALRLRNPDSGMGLTGSTSERDLQFLKESVAGLGNVREANYIMLITQAAKARREAELSELRADHILEHGNLQGFQDARREFIDSNPFFAQEEMQRIQALSQSGSSAAAPTGESVDDILSRHGVD